MDLSNVTNCILLGLEKWETKPAQLTVGTVMNKHNSQKSTIKQVFNLHLE
jgi:hypothetical protein